MAGTFTSELANEGNIFWAWVQIGGWGRRLNASAAALRNAYHFSTLDPEDEGYTEANADAYIPSLILPPDTLEERIDLRRGITELGDLTFQLIDPPQSQKNTEHGWQTSDLITDLMAITTQVSASGPWRLRISVSRTATTWALDDVTGIVANQSLHLGSETVLVTEIDAGANTLTVTRGVYDTQALEHDIDSSGGEGIIYDHPRFVRGRPVSLFVNLFDHRRLSTGGGNVTNTPQALSEAQAFRVFRGTIDDWEHDGANSWMFSCIPSLGRIDQSIGREQFVTRKVGELVDDGSLPAINGWLENDETITGTVQLPASVAGGLPVAEPQYDYAVHDGQRMQRLYLRVGSNLHYAEHWQNVGDPKTGSFRLQGHGLRPIGLTPWEYGKFDWAYHEVIPTHPSPSRTGASLPWFWPTFGGAKTTHPVDIMLSLITSTGTATNGDWDSLPRHWGAGVDVAHVNLSSFRRVKQRDSGLTMRNLILGWEGKPLPLREWLEANVLGPMGWFLYLDETGDIALSTVSDIYADPATLPQITEADLVDNIGGQHITPATMAGGLGATMIHQTWQWGRNPVSGEMTRTLTWRPAEAERYPEIQADGSFMAAWHGTSEAAEIAIVGRMNTLARWLHTPLPRIRLVVGLHRLELSLTNGVALTLTTLPNPFTRTRGFTVHPAIVVARSVDLASGVMVLELLLVPNDNIGLWAPAAQVTAWNAGTKTLTFDANIHTATDAGGATPDTDVEGFVVTQPLMLLDSDLQVRATDAPPTISSFPAANQATMSGDFTTGGAAQAPVAGDFVTFPHFSGAGAAPNATWSTEMALHVPQANDADGLFPDGSNAKLYGA